MTIITMSRQIGSGADEVASWLCADLDLVAFDKRLMLRVALEIGLNESEIVDYSEEQYERRGFFDRLFSRARPVAEVSSWRGGRAAGYERQVMTLDEDQAIGLIRATMSAAYERGKVLIIGRGGQAILEGKPGVFHVRVVAPFEDRIRRLRSQREMTSAQARRFIRERDRATAEYLRTFHHIDVDDPTLYHMVLNTGQLGVELAATVIESAIENVGVEAKGQDAG